jgi:hypothetical protein
LNSIFSKNFVHKNFAEKDIITEYEVAPFTEIISNITLEGENIPNNENIIGTVLNDKVLEYIIKEYVLEPQHKKYNPHIKKTALTYDSKIVGPQPFYSRTDASEYVSQGAPTKIKTKEILQDLIFGEEHTNSDLDAIVPQSSINNLSSKTLRSLIHTSKNIHKPLDKTTLERDIVRDDYTILILPKDKRMEDTLVSYPEIILTIVERRMFSDKTTDPIMINSPCKNKS